MNDDAARSTCWYIDWHPQVQEESAPQTGEELETSKKRLEKQEKEQEAKKQEADKHVEGNDLAALLPSFLQSTVASWPHKVAAHGASLKDVQGMCYARTRFAQGRNVGHIGGRVVGQITRGYPKPSSYQSLAVPMR